MRTYSFDHMQADKPEPSTTNPGGAEQTPPAEQAKPRTNNGQLHYGRQHAQTAELYRKHREERQRAEQTRAAKAQAEPMGAEASAPKVMEQQVAGREEPIVQEKAADEARREGIKGLAQQAVSSVLAAAKKAAKGHPLSGARKLAGDAFSGVRRVAREVSARRSRSTQDAPQEGAKQKKGPGKKR
ncbi:MAG TPA: hypothetical protein VEZ71_14795 [Archangium sp.]|nr:hypothetical protein [Archangium sp.]